MADNTATTTTPQTPTKPVAPSTWHFHIWYLVIILILAFGGHAWMQEHDARILAEANLKVNQTTVETLQKQIAENDAATDQQIQSLEAMIKTVRTPIQVVAQLPKVMDTPLPLPPTVLPDNSIDFPEADVLPLFKDLAQCKEDAVSLTSCQSDLTKEKEIVTTQNTEIKTLKQKPKFWSRVKHDTKLVGVGVGLAVIVAAAIALH